MVSCIFFFIISVYFTSALSSKTNNLTNLSSDEENALLNARKKLSLQILNPPQKSLLCTTFTSLRSEKSWRNIVQNVKYARERCEWLVVSYNFVDDILYSSRVALIDEVASSANTFVSIMRHSFGNVHGLMKPLLFDALLPLLKTYSKVWLMDEDISIVGFNFHSYFGIWDCAFNGASPPPVISQPLINGNKYTPPFTMEGWAMYQNSVVAVQSVWIEQQSPILDATFFSWYIENFVLPLKNDFIQSKSDFGYDQTWCGAANMWNQVLREVSLHGGSTRIEENSVSNPPCVIIMADNYVKHMDFKTIVDWHAKKMEWLSRSEYLVEAYKNKFPNTFFDGSRDSSFYDKKRWYSKSSGSCMQKSFLKTIPDSIADTPQRRQFFLSYAYPLMGSNSVI